MRSFNALLALGLAASAAAASSTGCGKSPPVSAGKTTSMSATFDGTKRTWLLYVPSGYSSSKPYPLVISHHGWGGSGSQDKSSSGMATQAASQGFIVAFPDGYADNSNRGSWGSWNCVGSILSPGSQGQTCTSWADPDNSYCYSSCGGCKGADGCDWTTCKSDVTPTGIGTSSVNGFIPQLYDYLESSLCVDTTREYATGMSNGAMMTYQLGASLSSRLAAIVPVAGSFHNGFIQAPKAAVPVYDIHGTKDTTVPGCSSSQSTCTSADGWIYSGTQAIASSWAVPNGCSGSSKTYKTSYDGTSGLACKSKGSCSKGDVVSCTWSGSHTYFASSSSKNGGLVWELLSKNANAAHLGCGRTSPQDPPCPASELRDVRTEAAVDGAHEYLTDFPAAEMAAVGDTPAQCALAKCATQAQACLVDAGCKSKVTCALACTTETCINGCAGASPDAATSGLVSCAIAQGCVTSGGDGGSGPAGPIEASATVGAVCLLGLVGTIAVALRRRNARAASASATAAAPAATPHPESYVKSDTFDNGTSRVSFGGSSDGALTVPEPREAVSL